MADHLENKEQMEQPHKSDIKANANETILPSNNEKSDKNDKYERMMAYSNVAMALFTALLFTLAILNYEKFILNVKLVSDGLEAQSKSIKMQSDSLQEQTRSIDLQRDGLESQKKSIDIQSESLQAQTASIKLQAKSLESQSESIRYQSQDILLNYQPIVFIKNVIPPAAVNEIPNPHKHGFVLTNSGKLPAREVRIAVIQSVIGEGIKILGGFTSVVILDKASLFPGSDLLFWVPPFIQSDRKIEKIELQFSISYKADPFKERIEENMKFIYGNMTNQQWVYVGPEIDIFANERKAFRMNMPEEERQKGKQFLKDNLKDYDHPGKKRWLEQMDK